MDDAITSRGLRRHQRASATSARSGGSGGLACLLFLTLFGASSSLGQGFTVTSCSTIGHSEMKHFTGWSWSIVLGAPRLCQEKMELSAEEEEFYNVAFGKVPPLCAGPNFNPEKIVLNATLSAMDSVSFLRKSKLEDAILHEVLVPLPTRDRAGLGDC